jgi:hypothetical protein
MKEPILVVNWNRVIHAFSQSFDFSSPLLAGWINVKFALAGNCLFFGRCQPTPTWIHVSGNNSHASMMGYADFLIGLVFAYVLDKCVVLCFPLHATGSRLLFVRYQPTPKLHFAPEVKKQDEEAEEQEEGRGLVFQKINER